MSFTELSPCFEGWFLILPVKAKPPLKFAISEKIALRLILSMPRGGLAFRRQLEHDTKWLQNICEKDLLLGHIVSKLPWD